MGQKFIIDGEIMIRRAVYEDAAKIYSAFSTQGEYLRQWLPIAADFNSVDDVQSYLEAADFENIIDFVIFYNDEFAGALSLNHISTFAHNAEIGYWLNRQFQCKGIMTRSVQAITRYAFSKMNMNRIVIKCVPTNERSRQIPIRLCFKLEGVARESEMSADGHFNDLEVYSLLKSDFSPMFCKKIEMV